MTDLPLMEPATEEKPTPRRSRTRWIVLGALAAVLVVLAAIIGPIGWRILNEERVSLTTPANAAGLTLDTSDEAKETADYLRSTIAAKITLSSTVGAVYRDPAHQNRNVFFFGGTNLQLSPAHQLDQALGLLNDASGGVTGLHEVPAGPLGGIMKCGTSNDNGDTMSVCGWADNASLAVALFPGRTVDDAAQLLRDLRAGIEHRG
ncbi:MAG: hypothetical protein AUI14_02710 [Actinobacteria bacterium 13_2_20CM_2_71_6]|nr:MAG: hypothetical protein AUI14_02710 [Actinobacteria bacterium 13_2_20CM_2_71_6]